MNTPTLLLLGCLSAPTAAFPIDTIAGTGKPGYSGDGGPAKAARLNQPFHCDLDGKGGLYIAEATNHCVRKVDLKTGIITTVAGCGRKGYSGDGGPATKATLNEPYAVAVTPTGDLYIVDRLNAVIRRVAGKTGIITTVAGTGKRGYTGDGGKGTAARLDEPNDCCLDSKGGLLIADVRDWRVRRLDLKTGILTTFAGTGRRKGKVDRKALGDGGPATKAVLHGARAVCVDGAGTTYICEREGNAVRRVDRDGIITTVAGTGARGFRDGPGHEARFNGPKGVRCDDAGNVYVVDTENDAIRIVSPGGKDVLTFVSGHKGPRGKVRADLKRPHGCVLDREGTLYIADSENHRLVRVRRR
jgi:sugar lactone lactonase YvrE